MLALCMRGVSPDTFRGYLYHVASSDEYVSDYLRSIMVSISVVALGKYALPS